MNSKTKYSPIAKFFHWVIAVLIIVNIIIGITLSMNHLKYLHVQIGLSILFLSVLRLLWRVTTIYPNKIDTGKKYEMLLATFVKHSMYILMFAVPISGILMAQAKGHNIRFFNILDIPQFISLQEKSVSHQYKLVHEYLSYIFIALIVLHIIGAFKAHFLDRNSVLSRMLPFK